MPFVLLALSITFALLVWVASRSRVHPPAGAVLVVPGGSGRRIIRRGAWLHPLARPIETVSLAAHPIALRWEGRRGLVFADSLRADVSATFVVRITDDDASIIRAAEALGSEDTGNAERLRALFRGRFAEAVEDGARRLTFREAHANPTNFAEALRERLSREDLFGYRVDHVAFDALEPTPIDQLDQENLFDAAGIRRTIEATTAERIRAEELAAAQRRALAEQRHRETLEELQRVREAIVSPKRERGT